MVHYRKYPLFNLTFILGSRSHKIMPQYLPRHMTYAPAKFEVATANGLGGYAIIKKYLFDINPQGQGQMRRCPVPSTSSDLYTCIV